MSQTKEARVSAEVEVDLYSGRPNPRFVLDAAAEAELTRRLTALPPASDGALRNGLGYRGLRVVFGSDAPLAGAYVSAGIVEIRERSGAVLRRADSGRSLERWLVGLGSGQLARNEVETLRQDLTR